ncbi:PAS domain-containing sensor histidine kinase [Coraliomargarita parva]|uniref:PAS domain-containing sensor histidine kinase n=1 Tax=Coraliomargarita parva TaxID=3014050 RepID=UPI0022B4E0C9|nr:PAS domain-containing sensor histidine kinase [Coraliomargarita parva]
MMNACPENAEKPLIESGEAPLRIEDMLRAEDGSFNQLIKNSFDMIVLLDENGIQKYVSESCERILGYKQSELIGIPVMDAFIHPEDRDALKKNFQELVRGEFNGAAEYRHRHQNGTWVHLETFGTNQLDNPAIRSLVLNVRNVSKRKKAEQALVESEARLRELNATKDKLFSIIAHDLRSPFNSIIGISDLLTDKSQPYEADDLEWCLETINGSAKNTLALLDNLLNWARSQTGQIHLVPELVDLSDVLRDAVALSLSASILKRVAFTYDPVDPVRVVADVNLLKTVLRNLLSNAIKYTKPGGEIRISVRALPRLAEVCVADNGIGIEASVREKLFDKTSFYSSEGTDHETGSGLGLILCREFVEKLGGTIWVESEAGQGSRFTFTVPLAS